MLNPKEIKVVASSGKKISKEKKPAKLKNKSLAQEILNQFKKLKSFMSK